MANETIKQAKDAVLDRITALAEDANTVSYTHLTLPTNREV